MYQIRSCERDCENLSHWGKNGRNLNRDKFRELGGKGLKEDYCFDQSQVIEIL